MGKKQGKEHLITEMIRQPKFSVVIPLYNKSAYIQKAIGSVLQQTFGEFELIVVNDGSTDDGLDRLKTLSDKRIRVINQPNAGVATARNNGVRAAAYDYVAFLDADDWWDEHFLEAMQRLIAQYPDAGLYGCNYYYLKNGKCRVEDKGLEDGFKAGYIDYFKVYARSFCVPFNSSFVIVAKHAFQAAGGFKVKLKFGEDFDLWARIALKYKVAYLNQPLAYSNQDVDCESRALGAGKFFERDAHFIFNSADLEKEAAGNPELKKLLDGLRVRSLLGYYLNDQESEAVRDQLTKVDFSKQPLYFRLLYCCPKPISKLFWAGKRWGSRCKQAGIWRSGTQGTFR